MAVRAQPYRFSVDEYYRMAEAGIFGQNDRVELVDGEILEMVPIGSEHAGAVTHLSSLFFHGAGDLAIVGVQNPIRLSPYDEPQPDLALLKPRADFYKSGHPSAQDVLLVVEVAQTSAGYDRGVKVPLYSRAGIQEFWILDLGARRLETYRDPSTEGYASVQQLHPSDEASPVALPGFVIKVGEILAH